MAGVWAVGEVEEGEVRSGWRVPDADGGTRVHVFFSLAGSHLKSVFW